MQLQSAVARRRWVDRARGRNVIYGGLNDASLPYENAASQMYRTAYMSHVHSSDSYRDTQRHLER